MKTILIVDDEEDISKLLENVFAGEGYRVYKANRCAEALSMLDKISPDLILLDIVMPEMCGIELCKRIKENHSFKNVPVIMMSSYDNVERKAESYIAGANDYVVKPFDTGKLLSKVKAELELSEAGTKQ